MTFLRLLQKCFRGSEIFIPGGRVITRRFFIFDSDYFGVYIHHICGRDHESLHNHPWKWSAALVLSGWYTEERATAASQIVTRILSVGRINFISQGTFHRIKDVSPKGAWTIYVHGARAQRDGFLVKTGEDWTYRDAKEVRLEATRPLERP